MVAPSAMDHLETCGEVGFESRQHTLAPDRPAQCGPRKQACGVECRQRRVLVVHDQWDFGATEHNSVAALVLHSPYDLLMKRDCIGFEDPANQLIHDDTVDFVAFGDARTKVLEPAGFKLFRIDVTVDEP